MTEKLRLRLRRGLSEAWWPGDASRTQEDGFEFGTKAVSAPSRSQALRGKARSVRCCSSGGSPCFWLPLSFRWGTHILDKTRRYRLPVPVNGALCYYDYVQPRAPGTGLSRDMIVKQKLGLKEIKLPCQK